jgi:hypothetical protein
MALIGLARRLTKRNTIAAVRFVVIAAWWLVFSLACVSSGLSGRADRPTDPANGLGVRIPTASDWTEQGVVLRTGGPGSWDLQFAWASTPSSVVKRDGTYFLYYGGERSVDDVPGDRAIGVATSPNGFDFTKYEGNPITPLGAHSSGVLFLEPDHFLMYYGHVTRNTSRSLYANGHVAISRDGLAFEHHSKPVLDHRNYLLYGYGHQLYPIAAYTYRGRFYVFYFPNGRTETLLPRTVAPWQAGASRHLAVAWGPSYDYLPRSARVVEGSNDVPAHMAANVVWPSADRILLFIQRGWTPNRWVEVRAAHPGAPHRLSEPLAIYDSPLWREETMFFTIFLDFDTRTWLLYRANWKGEFVLHTAPLEVAGPP